MGRRKISDSTVSYTADKIIVLDEITHIQTSPGMYIGELTTPTHLLEEALDNAIDEALAGYADKISIKIFTDTGTCSVSDTGRGLPYENDVPITISTKLFSGAKFKGSKKEYNIVAGKNGVGLVAVNALSKFFSIEIYREKHAIFEFKKCRFNGKTIQSYKGNKPFSTEVSFTPDPQFFESVTPDVDYIRKRLELASVELSDVKFILIVDNIEEEIKVTKEEFFIKYLLGEGERSKIFTFVSSKGDEKFEINFSYEYESTLMPRIITSVNLLPVNGGGTHVISFVNFMKDYLSTKAKKITSKIQPNDCVIGLRAYISLDIVNPEFASQSKDKLITKSSELEEFVSKVRKNMETYFDKNPEELKGLLNFFVDYRMKQESKNHKASTNGKRASTKFTKLRDCVSPGGELFIVEGDSAAGSLIQSRNPKIHAIFPLKGKIPNVVNAKDILKNKEISELVQALGCGIGPHFDLSKLKYSKIICAADADPDGGHISSLVTMVMVMLFPEIVKAGKFYLASTPLYSINEPKEFRPLWTEEEIEKARKDKRTILRAKGLGELSAKQIKICLMDSTRKLIKISYPKSMDEMIKLFTDPNEKRNLLKGE